MNIYTGIPISQKKLTPVLLLLDAFISGHLAASPKAAGILLADKIPPFASYSISNFTHKKKVIRKYKEPGTRKTTKIESTKILMMERNLTNPLNPNLDLRFVYLTCWGGKREPARYKLIQDTNTQELKVKSPSEGRM